VPIKLQIIETTAFESQKPCPDKLQSIDFCLTDR
jgi:hypothetical protein